MLHVFMYQRCSLIPFLYSMSILTIVEPYFELTFLCYVVYHP